MKFVSRTEVNKGWSGDRKYCAAAEDGSRFFLRVAPPEKAERTHRAFEFQRRVAALGIPVSLPLEISDGPDGSVSALYTCIDGSDAEEAVPALPAEVQRRLGQEAGRLLRRIHSLPAPEDAPDWEERFNRKMDRKIESYLACPIKVPGAECFIDYMEAHRALLRGRPQCFQHGDYHIGNMMLRDGEIVIIDFDRYDFGDPWEEFNRIVFCAEASRPFASGMVDGYFGGSVPPEFWELLALYVSSNALSSLPWAIPFGEGEVHKFTAQLLEIMDWYDHMRSVVPSWYGA